MEAVVSHEALESSLLQARIYEHSEWKSKTKNEIFDALENQRLRFGYVERR